MSNLATTRNLTVLGVAAIVTALSAAATALFDGDPATTVDLVNLIKEIGYGIGFILAKGAGTTGAQSIGGKPLA